MNGLLSYHEILSDLGVEGLDIAGSDLTDIEKYIASCYKRTKEAIASVCFSKTMILGNIKSEMRPEDIILAFVRDAAGRFLHIDAVNAKWDDLQNYLMPIDKERTDILTRISYELRYLQFVLSCRGLSEEYDRMLRMIEGLQNQVYADMHEKAYQIKRTLQSQVTGLNYGVISSSPLSSVIYSHDNIVAKADQQRRADARFNEALDEMRSTATATLLMRYDEYMKGVFEPYIEKYVTDVFNAFKVLLLLGVHIGAQPYT